MFRPTEYLRWAIANQGKFEFDLATSGTKTASQEEIGSAPALDQPGGVRELRRWIALYNDVPEEEVVPAFGTTHALWTAYTAMLAPGDEALVESPTYEPMYRILEGIGARVSFFERRRTEGFRIDVARVLSSMSPQTRLVVVANLHNPSGVRTPDGTIRALADGVAERGASLLVDEVYAPFDTMCDASGIWRGSARKLGSNVVTTSSLTKVFGLGPHRLGWVLAPAAMVTRAEDALISNIGHAPLSWGNLGVQVFERLPALAQRSRALLAGKREKVSAWVRARAGLAWSEPADGLFGFAWSERGDDLTEVATRAASDLGVLVVPGAFFGVPSALRISWSIDASRLDEALGRLARAFD